MSDVISPPASTPTRARLRDAFGETAGLLGLAVPLVVGLAASTLLGVTDTIMVAPLGAEPLAAVSLTSSAVMIHYAAIYGALSMVGVRIAHAHGARDHREIAALLRNGLALAAGIGALGAATMLLVGLALPWLGQPAEVLAILPPYWIAMALQLAPFALLTMLKQLFEAIGRPWVGVGFALLAVVLNVPLNWALIYGAFGLPALGLLGAGVASLLAETVAFAAAIAYWAWARGTRRLRLRATVTRARVYGSARDGAAIGLMYAAETAAVAVAAVMIGWFGAVALAANQVVNAVGAVLYMLPLGMAGAVAIRVGQAAGEGRSDRLGPIAAAALATVTLWCLGATLMLTFAGGVIASSITADPAIAALATTMFAVVAAMQVMDGVQSTALGALRGLLDTAWPTVVSLVAYWGLALPAAGLLAFGLELGPTGVWIGFGIGLAVAAVALCVRLARRLRAAPRPEATSDVAPARLRPDPPSASPPPREHDT